MGGSKKNPQKRCSIPQREADRAFIESDWAERDTSNLSAAAKIGAQACAYVLRATRMLGEAYCTTPPERDVE